MPRNLIYPNKPATSNLATVSWWAPAPTEYDDQGQRVERPAKSSEVERYIFSEAAANRGRELKVNPSPARHVAISSKREVARRQSAMRFENRGTQSVSVQEVAERDMRTAGVKILDEIFGER
jgi:hypothetical protein